MGRRHYSEASQSRSDIHDVSIPSVLNIDDSFSKIHMELIVQRGNNESKIKSEQTAGWAKRLKDTLEHGKVFTKRLPHWLKADADNNIVLIPEYVELIKRILSEGLQCYQPVLADENQEIADWLLRPHRQPAQLGFRTVLPVPA